MQLFHLSVDVICNAITIVLGINNSVGLLVLCLIQELGILFAIVLIFLTFFNTYTFKAGLLSLLIRKFLAALTVAAIYFSLSLTYHAWNLRLRWKKPYEYVWNEWLQTLYVLQKFLAVIYYHLYKRAALRLANIKYYEDSKWLRKHLNLR